VSPLKPLELNMKNIECFRYRVADVLQSITPKTIASVRAYELQRDLLCSARLKEHFETNPEDMKALKNAFKSVQVNSFLENPHNFFFI
jgi:ATP-dependent RNA helicase DDX56/DBP9